MAIVVASLCLVNLLLWFFFFRKFKKLFSTDNIIDKTREELNQLIKEVNRHAERDITLIDARIAELKNLIAQSDSRVDLLKSDVEKNRLTSVYQNKIENLGNLNRSKNSVSKKTLEAYQKNIPQKDDTAYSQVAADFAYELAKPSKIDNGQQNFFDSDSLKNEILKDSENIENVTQIPVLGDNIRFVDNPIVLKKSFNAEVNERYMRGETVEEIATALSRSVTEVQFALDMTE